ncbi:MAG TPA: transcriptional regulator [Pyrinomonadaceae bacterium]|nr:transcriptional regulator [Pyrinomonadaceae bacterium]
MREEGLTRDFRVGDEWLVQPGLNRVSGRGRVVQLQPKIMGVLCVLAERPGELVTRERLFETVWAGTHVTEHVLDRSISELRRAFGDTPKAPKVIETIPKAGYRLIAPVSINGDAAADAPRPAEHGPHELAGRPGRQSSRFWLRAGALSLAAGFLLLALYLLFYVRHVGHFHFRHP